MRGDLEVDLYFQKELLLTDESYSVESFRNSRNRVSGDSNSDEKGRKRGGGSERKREAKRRTRTSYLIS